MDLNRKNLKKIAISGKANSGKNTAAHLIADKFCEYIEEYTMLAFADPIKEMALLMFPWANKKCLYGPSKLRNNIIPHAANKQGEPLTYRQALIDMGTLGRSYKSDIWVDVLADRIKKSPDRDFIYQQPLVFPAPPIDKTLLLITDLRFVNEMEYLKSEGFFIIRLLRDTDQIINHGTETEQEKIRDDEFNLIIDNNSTLENLTKQIDQIRL
jgi:hypothetical protein